MNGSTRLEMSSTRSDPAGMVKAFATLRFVDDPLDSSEMTRQLGQLADDPVHPTNDPRLLEIRQMVEAQSLQPVVTCFWYGLAEGKLPTGPFGFQRLIRRIHGEIGTGFDIDDEESSGSRFAVA